jgi:hypothetical protein
MEYIRKGSFLDWFVGLVVPVQEIFGLPWLLCSAQYKIFFSSLDTVSFLLSPSPSKLGRQSCRVACLLIRVCGPTHTDRKNQRLLKIETKNKLGLS